ncbi:MAG TPA: AAA family ATPase [Thermoanaerobaculia bacterium]|nr:AAA family ATPase [Thermoanaerobaculia bacterium]
MPGFVIVSGLPASGKTTVASAIAKALDLPFFDKDSFLEELFQVEGVGDPNWRRQLSRRADERFQRVARAERTAVLTSWWKHPASALDSGTPTGWLEAPPGVAIEVHCECPVSVAANRFLARRRHPGHLDERWSRESLVAMLNEQQNCGPLFPAKAVTVNTEAHLELSALLGAVEAALVASNA